MLKRLTADEVAARLDRNPDVVRRWLEQGRLRGEKIGGDGRRGLWLVSEAAIAHFLRQEPRRLIRRTRSRAQP